MSTPRTTPPDATGPYTVPAASIRPAAPVRQSVEAPA
jgi:hypothetical protein